MKSKLRRPSRWSPRDATSVDKAVGQQIRKRRRMLGLTQAELGKIVGITAQQVQKYEAAANRLSISRLVELANALEAPIGWFFRLDEPLSERVDKITAALDNPETAQLLLTLVDPRYQRKLHAIRDLLSGFEPSGEVLSGLLDVSTITSRRRAGGVSR